MSDDIPLLDLRLIACAHGSSQQELSRLIGVSQSVVSRIARGEVTRVNAKTRQKLANFVETGVCPDESDRLSYRALDWALLHIQTQRDTDFLPRPFEYHAIAQCWRTVRAIIGARVLAEHTCGPAEIYFVPKSDSSVGLRRIVRIDPIDAIIYAACVFEMAPMIENRRVDASIACSNRLVVKDSEIAPEGRMYAEDGHQVFNQRVRELGTRHSHVLCADISDFYSQIGHSVLRRSLEDCGVSPERAENLTSLLRGISGGQDRGIPVGPYPSNLLAECLLSGVDHFLLQSGVTFARDNDDYWVFCDSERDCHRVNHLLAKHLSMSYGLALNDKTRIIEPSDGDVVGFGLDPFGPYGDWISAPSEGEQDATGLPGIEEADVEEIANLRVQDAFDHCLAKDKLPRFAVRLVFRRAEAGELDAPLLSLPNWDRLIPVLGDLMWYLIKGYVFIPNENLQRRLLDLARESTFSHLPYVKLWVSEVVTTTYAEWLGQEADQFCNEIRDSVGIRPLAKLAAKRSYRDWVRSHAGKWAGLSPWERRAITYGAKSLSRDERNTWIDRSLRTSLLDSVVALHYLAYDID